MIAIVLTGAGGFMWCVAVNASRTLVYFETILLSLVTALLAAALLLGRSREADGLGTVFLIAGTFNAATGVMAGGSLLRESLPLVLAVLVWLSVLFYPQGVSWTSRHPSTLLNRESKEFIAAYSLAAAIGIMVIAVLPALANYRIAYQIVNTVGVMQDLLRTHRALEAREKAVEQYYRRIHLSRDTGESAEKVRFKQDRLSLTLDRYESLPRWRTDPVVALPGKGYPPLLLDSVLSSLPVGRVVTPAVYWTPAKNGGLPNHEFRFSEGAVQFDARDDELDSELIQALQGEAQRWKWQSVARPLPDPGGFGRMPYVVLPALFAGAFTAVYATFRLLFFSKFRAVQPIQGIEAGAIESLTAPAIVLRVYGIDWTANARHPETTVCIDMRSIPETGFESLPSGGRNLIRNARTVIVDNFDHDFGSEQSAKTKLELLESLVLDDRRVVVLIGYLDPEEYILEVLHGDSQVAPELKAFLLSTRERWERVLLRFGKRILSDDRASNQEETTGQFARRIYTCCTDAQRAVLYQIAVHGWVNPHNEEAISSLIARGWIRLSPIPVLSGRLPEIGGVIKSVIRPDEVRRWEAPKDRPTTWATGLTIAAVVVLGAVLLTGADLAKTWTGTFTGILAGAPALWKMVSEFRGRAAAANPKPDMNA